MSFGWTHFAAGVFEPRQRVFLGTPPLFFLSILTGYVEGDFF